MNGRSRTVYHPTHASISKVNPLRGALPPGLPARGAVFGPEQVIDILPEVLIGAAVDVVVKGEESFLARHVLVSVGITDTWQQLLVLGVANVLIWGGESLFEYLYHLSSGAAWRRIFSMVCAWMSTVGCSVWIWRILRPSAPVI
ncbi:MAG: hypothetical protein K9K38_02350 [Rhodoferax sp.]|nr:hypothetical protein [Rhodoferax sp.]MCF8208233.1 hypothetical protein [Rhodoferax sp.]